MEEKDRIIELLEKQNRTAKLQCALMVVSALCCVVLALLVLSVMPRVEGVISQMGNVLTNLEQVTLQLAQADLDGMAANVDALVTTGQESLKQTMEKLDAIDFDALNKAIKDLADIIEPLAKFFNTFRK